MKRPNILYIHSHDTGRYIQPYGHAISTPNLQKLAEEGIFFRQAFTASPSCSPSRACLLTGRYAHSNGMIGLAHRGFALNDYSHHLVHTLRDAGYTSALVGVQHVAKRAEDIGYDEIYVQNSITESGHLDPSQEYQNTPSAEEVASAAGKFLKERPAQPFFLSVGFNETHREFKPSGPTEDPAYCLVPPPLPDTPETRQDMANFKASAQILDDGIGAILQLLETEGLSQNTLVICTTDHGLAFPDMKCTLTDHGTGVMLMIRGPGGFDRGRVCEAMVSNIDVFPTICDLLKIEQPAWLQGKSMLPLVRGETDQINDEIFGEINFHAAYEPQRAIRTQRWKYIRRFDGRHKPVLPNTDDSPSKDVWLQHDWANRNIPTEQLYDLIFDPAERQNLAEDPAYAQVLEEMRHRLNSWMQDTEDPLLKGAIDAPPNAQLNDVNALSPNEPTQVVSPKN